MKVRTSILKKLSGYTVNMDANILDLNNDYNDNNDECHWQYVSLMSSSIVSCFSLEFFFPIVKLSSNHSSCPWRKSNKSRSRTRTRTSTSTTRKPRTRTRTPVTGPGPRPGLKPRPGRGRDQVPEIVLGEKGTWHEKLEVLGFPMLLLGSSRSYYHSLSKNSLFVVISLVLPPVAWRKYRSQSLSHWGKNLYQSIRIFDKLLLLLQM